MNKSNCATCEHKRTNPDGGHCYMFKVEPQETCGIWKGVNVGTIGHIDHGKLTLTGSIARLLMKDNP